MRILLVEDERKVASFVARAARRRIQDGSSGMKRVPALRLRMMLLFCIVVGLAIAQAIVRA